MAEKMNKTKPKISASLNNELYSDLKAIYQWVVRLFDAGNDVDIEIHQILKDLVQGINADWALFAGPVDLKSNVFSAIVSWNTSPVRKKFHIRSFPWIFNRIKNNQVVMLTDPRDLPAHEEDRRFLNKFQIKSLICLPIINTDGTIAVLAAGSKSAENFDTQFLKSLGHMFLNARIRLTPPLNKVLLNISGEKSPEPLSGIWEYDLVAKTLHIDSRLGQMLGMNPEKTWLRFNDWEAYINPEEIVDISKIIHHAFNGKTKSFSFISRLNHPGKSHAYHVQGNIIGTRENGRILGTLTDRTQQTLRDIAFRKLTLAVRQSPIITVITDTSGNIEFVNEAFLKITGYMESHVLNKNPRILKSDEHPREFYELLWNTILKGNVWRGEFVNVRKNGMFYHEKASIYPLKDDHGNITHFIKVSENITPAKETEERLFMSEKRYRSLITAMNEGVALYEMIYENNKAVDYRFLDVNPAFEHIMHIQKSQIVNQLASQYYGTESPPFLEAFSNVVRTGKPMTFETFFPPLEKHFLLSVFIPEHGQIATIYYDITERLTAEMALKNSEATLNSIFRAVPAGIGVVINRHFISVNERIIEMTGYSRPELLGQNSRMLYISDEAYDRVGKDKYEQISHYGIGTVETQWQRKDGRIIDVLLSSSPLDPEDHNIGVTFTALDITERRESEFRIEQELKEKVVLLKEIHHRVKNNLQIIISLLNLQSHHIKDEVTLNAFKESKNRIRSMAIVHEKLYQSKSFSSIDFREYAETIIHELCRIYRTASSVSVQSHIEGIQLDLDSAVPCGLILNELITNALKHAFKDHQSGQIDIYFNQNETEYCLSVKDNGGGISNIPDLLQTESLGLKLVGILTEQLGGTIQIESNHGSRFEIRFPVTSGKM